MVKKIEERTGVQEVVQRRHVTSEYLQNRPVLVKYWFWLHIRYRSPRMQQNLKCTCDERLALISHETTGRHGDRAWRLPVRANAQNNLSKGFYRGNPERLRQQNHLSFWMIFPLCHQQNMSPGRITLIQHIRHRSRVKRPRVMVGVLTSGYGRLLRHGDP